MPDTLERYGVDIVGKGADTNQDAIKIASQHHAGGAVA
jgi:hypothetical protein